MSTKSVRIAVLLAGTLACAQGQWLNHSAPGVPRTPDGKPNLSAPAPKVKGKPDLSGIWQVDPPRPGEIEGIFGKLFEPFVVPGDDPRTFSKYFLNILSDFKPEDAPLQPAAAAIFKKNADSLGREGPSSQCLPVGIPNNHLLPVPHRIMQTPGVIAILYEADHTHRQIHTDGRKHPVDPQPSWLGYSIGKWEGEVLVVDTMGFNDKGWLDGFGHPRSEALRLTERYRRRDYGHLEVQVTIDDPKSYTKPFTIRFNETLTPDTDVLETVCNENEKDRVHLK